MPSESFPERPHDRSRSAETISANAKLTLSLRITGRRDDGYHLIDAEMVSIDLADTLTIGSADPTRISAAGPYATGVPTDDSNIVARALALAGRRAHVHIDKRIPHGGGLGGGSSDAAAVLRWAGYTDLDGASRIGADIPFCMTGGRARVSGIGEVIEPLAFRPLDLTLVIPPLHVSTPAVYRAFDDLDPRDAQPERVNDLEPAAVAVVPELGTWRDRIWEATGVRPILAGSGATWFVYGKHANALAAVGNEGAHIRQVSTVDTPPKP